MAKDFHIDKASPINYWAEGKSLSPYYKQKWPGKRDTAGEGTFALTEPLCNDKRRSTFKQA